MIISDLKFLAPFSLIPFSQKCGYILSAFIWIKETEIQRHSDECHVIIYILLLPQLPLFPTPIAMNFHCSFGDGLIWPIFFFFITTSSLLAN